MIGLLVLLAVLLVVAYRLRPRKHVTTQPDGSTTIIRARKPFDWNKP